MKQILLKSAIFCFIITVCFFIFWIVLCSNRCETLKIPQGKNIALFGNSHIECAVNDSILKNSFNWGRSAEQMEFIYCKVILLKRYNPQLDTIIIGYDNRLLNQSVSTECHSGLCSPYFYDIYELNDVKKILCNSSYSYIESHISHPFGWFKISDFIKTFFYNSKSIKDLPNLGGYINLNRDKLSEDINRNINTKYKAESYSNLSIYFLDKTISFCDKNNIKIMFLCPPQHKKCVFDSMNYKKFYAEKYNKITFLDYRDMALHDSCFSDLHHLNHKGAKIFSEYLEKKVLHKNNYNNNHNSLN